MLRIDEYIDELTDILKDAFGERLVYIGLQGPCLCNCRGFGFMICMVE